MLLAVDREAPDLGRSEALRDLRHVVEHVDVELLHGA
jgi:hypothetical protein